MTTTLVLQVAIGGLLLGLVYALVAAGLSLIFGLMDVVNFAHGELLMLAMYATFFLNAALGIDPLLLLPIVAGLLFVIGVVIYRLLISRALAVRFNSGMVQIFVTFGLSIFLVGAAQTAFGSDFRSITTGIVANRIVAFGPIVLPLPQLAAGVVCLLAFAALAAISRTEFGRALEATREDRDAVALIGIDRDWIFSIGWGIGAATVGIAGVMLATFYYISPTVGGGFRAHRVCDGGAGRVRVPDRSAGGRAAGRGRRGVDGAGDRPVAQAGRGVRHLPAGADGAAARSVRAALMEAGNAILRRRRRERWLGLALLIVAALLPLVVTGQYSRGLIVLVLLYAGLAQGWNVLGGYCGQISLGHALYFGIGAYTSTLLFTRWGVPPTIGLIPGAGLAAAVALAVGWPCFRLSGHYYAIATLVFGLIAALLVQKLGFRERGNGDHHPLP